MKIEMDATINHIVSRAETAKKLAVESINNSFNIGKINTNSDIFINLMDSSYNFCNLCISDINNAGFLHVELSRAIKNNLIREIQAAWNKLIDYFQIDYLPKYELDWSC